jgi:4,5-dihydroxyphthalate decarboxylase
MATQYGLDLDSVTWVLSGDEHVTSYRPPANVVPAGPGKKLGRMLLDGELDAVIGASLDSPDVVPLIPDPEAAAIAAVRERGLYPVNHLVVVRDEVLERHPEAAVAVFEAFAESKRRYVAELRAGAIASPDAADRLHLQVMAATGERDPLPYGIEPNRQVLEQLVAQARAQNILREPVDLDAAFASSVRGLVG